MTILAAEAARPGRASLLLALAKPRLNALAVATVAIGYYLGAQEFDLAVFLAVVAGSALVAGGGAAFNQVAERDLDALMARTRSRPLPTGGADYPSDLSRRMRLSLAPGTAAIGIESSKVARMPSFCTARARR